MELLCYVYYAMLEWFQRKSTLRKLPCSGSDQCPSQWFHNVFSILRCSLQCFERKQSIVLIFRKSNVLNLTVDVGLSFSISMSICFVCMSEEEYFWYLNINFISSKCSVSNDTYSSHHYGIPGNCLEWFTSYLNNRKQFTKLNYECSSTAAVPSDVPQGSILGLISY